jgi:hypothetical protein
MKTSSKFLIAAILAIVLPVCAFSAEIVEDDPVIATPAPKKTAAPAVTPKPAVIAVKTAAAAAPAAEPAVKKPEASPEAVAELKIKLDEMAKAMELLKDEIKALEEKGSATESVARDLEAYKKELETLQAGNGDTAKKIAELEKSIYGVQDTLKVKLDKLTSWDDILDVLKKQLSNNELEIARLKKEINGLKKQYGGGSDSIFDTIAQWPYMGVVAVLISIAAFITVVTRP